MRQEDIVSLIGKIRDKSNKYTVDEMEKNGISNLVTSHGDILFALFNNKKLTMAEISEKISKDKSTVTALVSKLVDYGYVEKIKDSLDSRITYVSLTTKGFELKPIFDDISSKLINKFYINVHDDEKEMLLNTLQKILKNF